VSAAAASNPLWQQAEQAEKAGNYAEAVRLYQQFGREVANTNHALSVQALNRAQYLTDALQGRRRLTPHPRGTDSRYPAPGRIAPSVAGAPTAPAGYVNSGPGRLRRAHRCVDYRVGWVLENSRGIPIVYAVPMPGHRLDEYANENVELIGTQQFRNDLRAYLMTVYQVRRLP
jgi:hypothetical protein